MGWKSDDESVRRDKQQKFGDNRKSTSKYLDLSRNKVMIRVSEKLLGFSAKCYDRAGEVKMLIFLIARDDARVATAIRCFTEQETRGCQWQKLYADA